MVFAHVIYKKTNLERKTTVKAYNLLKNQYTLLGYVDENDNPVEGPEPQVKSKTQKKSAVPAANRQQMSAEEIESKKAELRAMNEAAIQKAKEEQAKAEKSQTISVPEKVETHPNAEGADQVQPIQRKKPGPKPKVNA